MKKTTEELWRYDKSLNKVIVGVDEAGRGPLAGPVVCAAVVMPFGDVDMINLVNDSKVLNEKTRNRLWNEIRDRAVDYSIWRIEREEIDEINILEATKLGMQLCVNAIKSDYDIVCIDYVNLNLNKPVRAITKGDSISYSIACASILAKVARDKFMVKMHEEYPQYGFDSHKGYGTQAHIQAIRQYGLTPLHRRSFCKKLID